MASYCIEEQKYMIATIEYFNFHLEPFVDDSQSRVEFCPI